MITYSAGYLSDIWKFENGIWTWMGGSSTPGFPGVAVNFGQKGVPRSENTPGGRTFGAAVVTGDGTVYYFGGYYPINPNGKCVTLLCSIGHN